MRGLDTLAGLLPADLLTSCTVHPSQRSESRGNVQNTDGLDPLISLMRSFLRPIEWGQPCVVLRLDCVAARYMSLSLSRDQPDS